MSLDADLKSLLASTKDSDSREKLSRTIPHANIFIKSYEKISPVSVTTTTLLWRLYANLCTERQFQDELIKMADMNAFISNLVSICHSGADVGAYHRAGFRLLCNLITSNDNTQNVVWKIAFPTKFSQLITSDTTCFELLCALLYNSITNNTDRREQLFRSSLFPEMVKHHETFLDAEHSEALQWIALLIRACSMHSSTMLTHVCKTATWHQKASFLRHVDIIFEDGKGELNEWSPESRIAVCRSLSFLLSEATTFLNGDKQTKRDKEEEQPKQLHQVISTCLDILGQLSAGDKPGDEEDDLHMDGRGARALLGEDECPDTVNAAIAVLEYVNPPPSRKESQQQQTLPPSASTVGWVSGSLRLLANITFHNSANQSAAGGRGMRAVLKHTSWPLDPSTPEPFAREWAMFAIRALSEGHEGNQAFLRDLPQKPAEVLASEYLDSIGAEASLDGSGQVKISKKNPH